MFMNIYRYLLGWLTHHSRVIDAAERLDKKKIDQHILDAMLKGDSEHFDITTLRVATLGLTRSLVIAMEPCTHGRGICADMCINLCAGMCTHLCRHVCGHAYRHACIHVYRHVCIHLYRHAYRHTSRSV